MIIATRCLATQSAGRPMPPAFTSMNDFSISDNGGGDLLTITGPTGNRRDRGLKKNEKHEKQREKIYILQ